MPIQHIVKTGDTISAIAKRYGVPVSSVSGFRSNDPNVIFPEEVLTIQTPQEQPQFPASEAGNCGCSCGVCIVNTSSGKITFGSFERKPDTEETGTPYLLAIALIVSPVLTIC